MSQSVHEGTAGRHAETRQTWKAGRLAAGILLLLGSIVAVTVGLIVSNQHGAAPRAVKSSVGPPCSQERFVVDGRSWPNCADTGVPPGTKLKKLVSPSPTGYGDSTVTEIHKSGSVLNGIELTGSIDVWANNVTIENSVIYARSWWGINLRHGYHGLRVLHCTIIGLPGQGPDNGAEDYGVSSSGSYIEVGWSNLSGFGDAISLGIGYVHDNYVHDLRWFIPAGSSSYNHDDAFISDGANNLVIKHNTFLNQVPPEKGASGSVGLFHDAGFIANTTVIDNYIGGGSYSIYPGGGSSSSNVHIIDNVFSTRYWPNGGFYGPVASKYWHFGRGNAWSNNRWADGPKAGQLVPA
jgi:hypothetical protein